MNNKTIAILQSNYIPWKGYFDIINSVDLFIFHDNLQYTKQDWRNRNKIKTPQGLQWLTIPCGSDENRLICDVELDDKKWQKSHWNKIKNAYFHAPFFNMYKDFFEEIYLGRQWSYLSELNQYIIKKIAKDILKSNTVFEDSRKYDLKKKKAQRVIELLKKVNAVKYISGPSAAFYLDEQMFINENIMLEWMDYSGYPEYNQLYPPFVHEVSVIDLIFNEGEGAKKFMKSF